MKSQDAFEIQLYGIDGETVTVTINPGPPEDEEDTQSFLDIEIFAQNSLKARFDAIDMEKLIKFLVAWRLSMYDDDEED
jgi:hypothetical protein